MRAILIILFLLFFLLQGCTGGKGSLGLTTLSNCNNQIRGDDGNLRDKNDGEKMLCYHEAAISQAITCGSRDKTCSGTAAGICTQIAGLVGSDKKNIAEEQMNYCLQDVAMYTKDDSICNKIMTSSALDYLRGTDTAQEVCTKTVQRMQKADPSNYLSSPNNLCSLAFIFPLIGYFVFISRRSFKW